MFTALCAIAAGIGGFALCWQLDNGALAILVARLRKAEARIARAKSMDTPKSNATVKRILRALDGE
jgi:hypothetical protein